MNPVFTTLDAKLLQNYARELTGIDCIDTAIEEPLQVMAASLNNESELHPEGMQAMGERLVRLLSNRLRMQRDFSLHPEIEEQVIKAPLIICGMARTGSTKMQKLLAATGDFNWLPYWQASFPALLSGDKNESPQPRIDAAVEYCHWFDQKSPEAKFGHAQEAMEPDEESYMLEHSLLTPCFLGWADMPSYIQWLYTTDMTAQFRLLKQCLQYLQWQGLQCEAKPWVLKCPLYFGLEPALLSVFPDATLVMTHRHPKETMPSSCRLLETFHLPFTNKSLDYQEFFQGSALQIAMHLQVRATGKVSYLDLPFKHIVKDPEGVCEQVYAAYGLPFSTEAREKVNAWHHAHPQKPGAHKYSLEDFDFSEAMIDEAFADYISLIDTIA